MFFLKHLKGDQVVNHPLYIPVTNINSLQPASSQAFHFLQFCKHIYTSFTTLVLQSVNFSTALDYISGANKNIWEIKQILV